MKQLTPLGKASKLPSREAVLQFCSISGISLPEDLISLFVTQNPIYVEENMYYPPAGDPYDISFLPFRVNGMDDDIWFFQDSFHNLFEDFFAGEYVSFGSDSGGWDYVVSLREGDYGTVHHCRMDTAPPEGLTRIAASLTSFIDSLRSETEAA